MEDGTLYRAEMLRLHQEIRRLEARILEMRELYVTREQRAELRTRQPESVKCDWCDGKGVVGSGTV